MVPDIAGTGHSFKGAMAYYLHDKRQEAGAAHLLSAERVAWTATRNLATDDPQTATRIMVATAQSADELKAAAGVSTKGRKSKAHVYAYSLAWHPDEAGNLDKAEMLRAADQTLKALGAEKHQAIIICHTDRQHPHIHVVVNRVCPETGRMLPTSNDRLKLSDWANQYERERGQIVTPKREEKRMLREHFKERSARQDFAQEQRQKAEQKPRAERSEGSILKELSDAQKKLHSLQWKKLAADNKERRDAVYTVYGEAIKQAAAARKEANKPQWAQHFKDARAEQRAFDRREQSISGIVRNSLSTTLHQQQRGEIPDKGRLAQTFRNVLDSQARRTAFAQQQEDARQLAAARFKAALDAEIGQIKDLRSRDLAAQRELYTQERTALIAKQDGEKAKMREAWRQLYERRHVSGRQMEKRQAWQQARRIEKTARPVQTSPHVPRAERYAPTPQQQEKRIERAQRLAVPAPSEPQAMKFSRSFGKAATPKPEAPKAAPTERQFVAQSQPAPAPAGAPPVPARRAQDVPAQPNPSRAVQVQKPAPAPRKDWKQAAAAKPAQAQKPTATKPAPQQRAAQAQAQKPVAAKPAPAPRKDWTPPPKPAAPERLKDWNARASGDKPREIRPLPPRNRDRDRDR